MQNFNHNSKEVIKIKKNDGKILGTIKRGTVKIYSPKEMRFLHWKKLPHTHFKYEGKKVTKVRHTY